jgi:hypothetical protein
MTRRPSSLRRFFYEVLIDHYGTIAGVLICLLAFVMMMERAR